MIFIIQAGSGSGILKIGSGIRCKTVWIRNTGILRPTRAAGLHKFMEQGRVHIFNLGIWLAGEKI